MRLQVVVALFCAVAAPAHAMRLSVGDAMKIAEERSEAVVSASAQLQRAEAQEVQAWSAWLPQANGTVSYQRTLASEFDALLTAPSADVTGSPFAALPFGRPNTWNAGITVHETLLDAGGMLANIHAAQAGVNAQSANVESTRAQAVLAAVTAYYEAILAEKLLTISQATFKQ